MAVQTFNDRSLDAVAMAAESLLPEENSFTILSSELMLKGDYLRDGDDLIIRGDLGEEIRVEEYFSADVPPTLETPYGAVVLPETVQKLLVNVDSFEVAGPAGSLSIPGLLGDPIGTIDELGGDAQATAKGADGVVRTLNEGDPIYQDDVIETIGRSFANLRMLDDTSFQLGKETRAIIENYNYTPGVESGQFEATVISGFFRYASGKLGGLDKGTHTTIKTPTAQIGVRGSEMEGIIEEDGSSTFVHKDGILDVSDANGRGTVTLDEPGMATAVSSKPGAPATAFEAPASLLATFEEALPPPPDFVVTHDEEEAEGEGELLAQQAALVDGEGEEEGEGEGGEEPLAPVVEVVEVEEEVKVEEVQQNAVPTAFNDLLTGEEDGIVTGTLASNDQLGDGKHTWFVAGQPEHGTVVISADGSFTYTPDPNYNGVDSFTYTIRDVDGDESTAQVIVSLSEVNDAPVLMVDGVLVFKEGDLPLQGQLNVTDVDNTGDQLLGATITINNALATDELSFTPPEGSSIQAEYVVENGVGTLTLTGAGSYADYQDAMLNVLFKSSGGEDPTQNGLTPTRSITWTVTENDGSAEGLVSEPFTLDVNITPVNNPPTLSGEPTKPVPYGSPAEASKALFPSLDIDPIEDWQTIQRLVFSVTGVTPGDAQEMLLVGSPAEAVPLVFTQGVVTELADGTVISYGEGNDGRLLISMEGEWNQNEISDFIRSIRYQNDNPNPVEGNREIALELVIDDGGNEFGGVDTAQLSGVSATVAVLLPPTLSVEADVIPQQQHFYETSDNYPNQDSAPSPVQLFPLADSQAAVFGLDDGNQNVNQLVVRVEGVALDDLILLGVAEIDLSQNMTEATAVPFTSLPEFQYQVVEAMDPNGDPIAGAKDLVLTGDWSSEQLISLINDLKFTNVGDDPDVSGANPTRKISIQTLRDDGGSLGVASDDAVGLQDSALSTVINVYSINDLPYHTDGVVTYEYAGEQTAGLFAGATATPVELSGTITELVLSITNLSSEAAEQLIVGGTAINLVGEASGSVSSATNSVANYDYEISPIDAVTGQAVVTLTGSWNSAEISELISGIAYSSSESILAQSRTIKVERIVDDQGGQYVSDNLFTVVKSPANQPPTLTVESGDPAQDVVFYEEEDADGGGAYVSVFDGLTFASSAGLNEDSIQNIGGIKVVVQNVVAGDWIRVHGTVISLTDDTGANLSADDYSFKYAIDYDPITKTTEIKLSPDSMEWNSGDGSDEVDALLQSIDFKNDSVDPAPTAESLTRVFTITEITDLGDNLETAEIDEAVTTRLIDTESGEISRTVIIDSYNQNPDIAGENVDGTEDRYTVSGNEVDLFTVSETGAVTAIEGSQRIISLTFTVTGVGGFQGEQDGSGEWIRVGGYHDISTLADWIGETRIALSSGESQGEITLGENVGGEYLENTVTVSSVVEMVEGDGSGRTITLNFEGGISASQADYLVEGMAFGVNYDPDSENPLLISSGERTIALNQIQDDGGTERGVDTNIEDLGISSSVEVILDADGGATIVNKNLSTYQDDQGEWRQTEDAEKSSQYFEYDEAKGALLSEVDSFSISMRLDAESVSSIFDENKSFTLFSYIPSDEGAASAIKLVYDSGTEGIVVVYDTGKETANQVDGVLSETSSTPLIVKNDDGVLVTGENDSLLKVDNFVNGQVYEIKLDYVGSIGAQQQDGTSVDVGKFSLTLSDVGGYEQGTYIYAATDLEIDNIGQSNFLEAGGVAQFGAPGFTGTVYDISVKAKIGESEKEAHWEMDRFDEMGTSEVVEVVADSLGSSIYSLNVIDTAKNDSSLDVDTILVKEAVDIGELDYLLSNTQFTSDPSVKADINNLKIDLTDVNEISQTQTLVASDVLELGINRVEVFGDATDQLDLQGWTQDTADTTHYTFTSSTSGEVVELFVQAEVNANVTLN